jgi:hypothetical protein
MGLGRAGIRSDIMPVKNDAWNELGVSAAGPSQAPGIVVIIKLFDHRRVAKVCRASENS